ncbi:efflux RND transporter periplasmic adaptor subunit [Ruminococcus sp.]|uniref:efflux RND transporter periplasmic adaptor subunit n=1 Tax=Ruminococcus sp. TaxID=41978 RepID=UPI003AB2E6E8
MNIKVDLKKLIAAAVSAIMCLSAGGCYLLPDEEEVLDAPTVKASDVTYSTVTAKKKDLEKKIVATGTVTAENQYTLSYEKQSGTVSKFYVKAGDKVKKGDVICDLDTYDLDYQIEEKQLYLEKAKLKVDIIYEGGGTQAEIDSAYVDVQLLEKELEKLQAQKEDSSLKSPIDGVVSSLSDVRAGDNVNPGQTIATVIDTSALYIAIQPDDLTQYDIDTEVQIRIGEDYYDGVVFMTPKKLADYQTEQNEDHNNVDDTGIDYQADTIYVRFKDTAPAEAVGQLADTILVLDSVKDAIVISNNLIKKVDGTKVVYVLKNGEKTAVEVETGLSTGSQTEIRSGLKEGDEIVIR